MSTRFLHLRELVEPHVYLTKRVEYRKDKRGITVAAEIEDNESGDGTNVTFGWTIQQPIDNYDKAVGRRLAVERLTDGSPSVTVNFVNDFPLKYQFVNAISIALDFYENKEKKKGLTNEEYGDMFFAQRTFDILMDIAEANLWYFDVPRNQIPSIEPRILVHTMAKLSQASAHMTELERIITNYESTRTLFNLR